MAYFLKKKQVLDSGTPAPPPASTEAPPPAATSGSTTPAQFPTGQAGPGGSGWVNLQGYLGLNQDQGRGMAQTLADGVGSGAKESIDNLFSEHGTTLGEDRTAGRDVRFGSMSQMGGYGDVALRADQEGQKAKGLTMFSPRATMFAEQYGNNYSPGMGRWDSFLSGAAGGDVLKQASDQYGGLTDYLSGRNTESSTAAGVTQGQIGDARAVAAGQKETADAAERARQSKEWADAYGGFSVWDNKPDAPITGRLDWQTFGAMKPDDTNSVFGAFSASLGQTWGSGGPNSIGEGTYNQMNPAEVSELLRIHRLQYTNARAFQDQRRDFAAAMRAKYGG